LLRFPSSGDIADDGGGSGHLAAIVANEDDRKLEGDAAVVFAHRGDGQKCCAW